MCRIPFCTLSSLLRFSDEFGAKKYMGFFTVLSSKAHLGTPKDSRSVIKNEERFCVCVCFIDRVTFLGVARQGEEVLEILCRSTSSKAHIEALRVLRNASPALGASAYALFKSEVKKCF
jgi:hypothetical protein